MDNQKLDISVLRYINNELGLEEKSEFKALMSSNKEALKLYNEYKSIQVGINVYAKNEMKLNLELAHTKITNSSALKSYEPSINGASGFSFGALVFKIVVALGIVFSVLFYFDKLPIKGEYIKQVKETLKEIKLEEKVDTLYYETTKVKLGDTVLIKTEQELINLNNKADQNVEVDNTKSEILE